MRKQPKSARQTYIDAHYDDYFAAQRRHQRRSDAYNAVVNIIILAIVCGLIYAAVHFKWFTS